MKNLMSALAISALLASPVFAEGEHQHDGDPNTQGKQGSMMMSHERMMPMMLIAIGEQLFLGSEKRKQAVSQSQAHERHH